MLEYVQTAALLCLLISHYVRAFPDSVQNFPIFELFFPL
jgi:hypothetical protein